MKKVKSMSASKLSKFADVVLRYVSTNVSQKEVMSLLVNAPEYLGYEQVNSRIPIDNTYHADKLQGAYVLIIDLQKNADYWYSLVYLDKDISEDIYTEIKIEKAHEEAKKTADKEAKKSDEDFMKLAQAAAAIAGVVPSDGKTTSADAGTASGEASNSSEAAASSDGG